MIDDVAKSVVRWSIFVDNPTVVIETIGWSTATVGVARRVYFD